MHHLFVGDFTVGMNLFCPDDVTLLGLPFEQLVEAFAES